MHAARFASLACLGTCVLVCACPSPPASTTPAAANGVHSNPAAERFTRGEALLEEPVARTGHCELTASGAVDAKLTAVLTLGADERVELSVSGQFDGQPVAASMSADLDDVEIIVGDTSRREINPGHVREAITVGLMRMGLLHNAAMLIAGELPDHADGGVREWVQTVEHRHAASADGSDEALVFDLRVAGGVPSQAELSFDADGLPARRKQVVEFPEGTMHVTETCRWQ